MFFSSKLIMIIYLIGIFIYEESTLIEFNYTTGSTFFSFSAYSAVSMITLIMSLERKDDSKKKILFLV